MDSPSGLSGVLWRGQKLGLLCTVSPEGFLALTPAHAGRPSRDEAKFNGDRTRPQSYLNLCAIPIGTEQIFWPLQRMLLSPEAF